MSKKAAKKKVSTPANKLPPDAVVNTTAKLPPAPDMAPEHYSRVISAVIGFRQTLAQILSEQAKYPVPPTTVSEQVIALQDNIHDMECWLVKRARARHLNFPDPFSHIPEGNPIRHV